MEYNDKELSVFFILRRSLYLRLSSLKVRATSTYSIRLEKMETVGTQIESHEWANV